MKGFVKGVFSSIFGICNYYLNRLVDIKKFPKAEGSLRQLQECDAVLLRIFDEVCKQYSLKYWLDYGTLLGAVRHDGFLPWDDDMDVSMLRADYDKAYPIFKSIFESYGLEVKLNTGHIGIGYKHEDTGVWLDVFPVDVVKVKDLSSNTVHNIVEGFDKLRKYCKKNSQLIEDPTFIKKETFRRNKLIKNLSEIEGQYDVFVHGVETYGLSVDACPGRLIFPLDSIDFEGYEFKCPKNKNEYLISIYGKDYMCFPHDGVEHHDGNRGIKISEWSIVSNTDMIKIKDELSSILGDIINKDEQYGRIDYNN